MDIMVQMKTADIILKVLRGNLKEICPYPFVGQKEAYDPQKGLGIPLPRSTPEAEGIPSQAVEKLIASLGDAVDINPHAFFLLRHGKVIAEGCFAPYQPDYAHMIYSMTKSVTGTAVLFAIQEGLLSTGDRLIDIFREKTPLLRNSRMNGVTIHHLLSMTSGVVFNEMGSLAAKDWVRAFLESDVAFVPGAQFHYNSLNTYMLAAAVVKRAGMSLVDYLTPRLFSPLGFSPVHWEKCPLGIEKGGWGLGIRLEDMAKLGQFYLQEGRWVVDGEERELLSPDLIHLATQKQVETNDENCGYGYQLWMSPIEGLYQFNGIFGQSVFIYPEEEIVFALLSGNQDLSPQGSTLDLFCSFLEDRENLRPSPLPPGKRAFAHLQSYCQGLTAYKMPLAPKVPGFWQRIFTRPKDQEIEDLSIKLLCGCYQLKKSLGSPMPIILQAIHLNFSTGCTGIRFACQGKDACTITFEEGDVENTLSIGLDGTPRYSDYILRTECYRVGSVAVWARDEDGHPVLKVRMSFIETPHTRLLKCFFLDAEHILLRFDETPSAEASIGVVTTLLNEHDKSKLMNRKMQIEERLTRVLLPQAKGEKRQAAEKSPLADPIE